MIAGIKIKKLNPIADERGRLMELLRSDDDVFEKFGQVYMTTVRPNVIKAWHYHKKQDDYFVCIKGMIKLVVYDNRTDSKTYKEVNEFFIGVYNPVLVKIPRGAFHGFKCISEEESIVINIPNQVYDKQNPDEYRVDVDASSIPYDWRKKIDG